LRQGFVEADRREQTFKPEFSEPSVTLVPKALTLAADDKITDPSIVSQLRAD